MKELNKTLDYMKEHTPVNYKNLEFVNKTALETLLNAYDLIKMELEK